VTSRDTELARDIIVRDRRVTSASPQLDYRPWICVTKYASVYSTAFILTTYTLLVNPDQPRITAPRTRHADSSISYRDAPRTTESSAISQIGHESAVYWHIELTRNASDNLIRKPARTVYKETVHTRVKQTTTRTRIRLQTRLFCSLRENPLI
jgi:hypothetical protein